MVPISLDCPGCGAQTRSGAIVVGPASLTNVAGLSLQNDILKNPWTRLEAFAFVESLGGRVEGVDRFIANRFHSMFASRNDRLISICEHCSDGLPSAAIRSAAMNGFVRLGQSQLLINERLMLFSQDTALTEFHGGTSIEEGDLKEPDYALMLICDTESAAGETGTIELWHSVARSDYAIVAKGHEGLEMLRDGLNNNLVSVVETIADLGLVLTQLHLAQVSSPYCELARDLFLEALGRMGYRQED